MISAGQIATKVFDGVAKKLSGAIHSEILTVNVEGNYNPVTGQKDDVAGSPHNCRALIEKTPRGGELGTYKIAKKEILLLVEGPLSHPKGE